MDYNSLIRKASYRLSSVGYTRLGIEWRYENIISAFSRLYLISEGEAVVYIGGEKVRLEKDYLYLIPSFTNCSYICDEYMEQYYATFTIDLENGMNLYQLFNTKYCVKAETFHYNLFQKLCDDNKGLELRVGDPRKYQKNLEIESKEQTNLNSLLSSSGSLSLLLSEFVESPKINFQQRGQVEITESIKYIHAHISEYITLNFLAERACLSPDHYTRKFKKLTGQTPIEYLNRQRVEKAQLILNTSTKSMSEIALHCGFSDSSYFGKVFKKYLHQSPMEYRRMNEGL